jgi:hypothetical protein
VNTPLSFVEAWCAHQGAVVEPLAEGVEILQPTELVTALGLPEHARYSEQPGPGSVWVGYGSPVLEKLLQAANREAPWVALTLELICDEKLHVICAQCVPQAEGRWQCPACHCL